MTDVLFVCVHNAGRSQMAKALFNHVARGMGLDLVADSAGTIPGGSIHSNVLQAMKEIGLDLSGETPKLLTDEMVKGARRVITMGCQVEAEACPAILYRGVEDWGLPDPKGKTLPETRAIRDEIKERVKRLVSSLLSD